MTRQKITAAGLRELESLAPQVAAYVQDLKQRYHTRRVNFESHSAGWRCYLAEGVTYRFYPPNGHAPLSTRMICDNTIGSYNDGVNYHVGEQTPAMPEGTWIVELKLFLGRPFIDVHYIGQLALALKEMTR